VQAEVGQQASLKADHATTAKFLKNLVPANEPMFALAAAA
jgi:hypothetical protein